MKKLLFALGLVTIFTLSFTALWAKETKVIETENLLKKAGQELLNSREALLQDLKGSIESYIQKIPEDGKVSKKEIKTLLREIRNFEREKKIADKRLKIYGLTTTTSIHLADLKKALSGYRTRDIDGKIRKELAKLTGKDLLVVASVNWAVIPFGVTFICIGGWINWERRILDEKNPIPVAIIGILLSVIGVLFLLKGFGVF